MIEHVTVVDNFASKGAGLFFHNGSNPIVNNSIFWHSAPNQIRPANNSSGEENNTIVISYSNIGGYIGSLIWEK
mgnify:CR=1 FL=1